MVLALEMLFLVLIVVAVFAFTRKKEPSEAPWPFVPRKLMTAPELMLFHRLIEAFPENYVLARLPLSQVLDVKEGEPVQQWREELSQKSLDFAVCSPDSSVMLAIQLDDASRKIPERERSDAAMDKALTDAGVKILRWNASAVPDVSAIRAAFTTGAVR